MKLSVEILDHIFSFLVSDHTLFACLQDPVLSLIAERHVYYRMSFQFTELYCDPFNLEFLSKNPRIFSYVRVLHIRVGLDPYITEDDDLAIKKGLDWFAQTLLMFPVLECITLKTFTKRLFRWPDRFRAALEDRLSLPTVKRLHIGGNHDFSWSSIDSCKNIEELLLSWPIIDTKPGVCNSNLPQLKSLSLIDWPKRPDSFLAMLQPHIKELRSLKCARFVAKGLSSLLGLCMQTLNKLEIELDCSLYSFDCHLKELSELVPIPPNLQLELTIHAPVNTMPYFRVGGTSYLPACAEIINVYMSSLRHLILDIEIYISGTYSSLAKVDFSPLTVLAAAALLIPRIDLYVHTDYLPSHVTLAQLLFSLEDCEGIMRSIEEGRLIIHSEKTLQKELGSDCLF